MAYRVATYPLSSVSYFVQILDIRKHRAIRSLDLGVDGVDHVVFIGRVGATTVAQTEVACGQPQRVTGENVSRPGAGVARQQHRVDTTPLVHRSLCPDKRRIQGGAVGIVAAGHVDLDIAKASLSQVRLECSQS